MKGFQCDDCEAFVPTLPPTTIRYVSEDEDGQRFEQIADLCRPCGDRLAAEFGLRVPPPAEDTDAA